MLVSSMDALGNHGILASEMVHTNLITALTPARRGWETAIRRRRRPRRGRRAGADGRVWLRRGRGRYGSLDGLGADEDRDDGAGVEREDSVAEDLRLVSNDRHLRWLALPVCIEGLKEWKGNTSLTA